ncbi:MAG: SMP-30/gluconolactonase/LRE family protein [Rhodospirillaceae bacterium]|nr:SMP-30/gluconolactonase/LRE family protein [Rhodospirillaceae bacterium]
MTAVSCVLEVGCQLGEGPLWQHAEGALWWLDIRGRVLHRWQPETGARHDWPLHDLCGCFALARDGRVILAMRSGLHDFNPQTGALHRIAHPEADLPGNRPNDGKCDRAGRFWFGTMQANFDDAGGGLPITRLSGWIHRLDGDQSLRRFDGPFGIVNTFAWSPDDRVMYSADTLAGELHAYDFDVAAGTIANRRVFAAPEGHGLPDGSTIDAEGHLWNARVNHGSLIRFSPDGRMEREIPLPVTRPTSCIFGGPDLRTLYITTASDELTPEQQAAQPLAGHLFALRTEVPGLPETPFAG